MHIITVHNVIVDLVSQSTGCGSATLRVGRNGLRRVRRVDNAVGIPNNGQLEGVEIQIRRLPFPDPCQEVWFTNLIRT